MSSCHVMLYHVISAENVVKVMSDGLGGCYSCQLHMSSCHVMSAEEVVKVMSDGLGGCNLCQQHMSSCHVVTVGDVDNIGDKKSRPLDVA